MFGSGEILVIMIVILILFGGKRLPEFAQALGKGIREFKKACNGEDEMMTPSAPPPSSHSAVKESPPQTLEIPSSKDSS